MTATKSATPNPRTDWERMQPLWQAGVVSVSQLAKDFNVSRAGILKHWDKLRIGRDLSGKIAAQANAIVARQEVAAKRLQEQVAAATDPVTEAETVATNAEIQANIILAERKGVQRLRVLFNTIVVEMETPAAPPLPIATRLDQLRKASETFKTIVGMERLVNNIVEDTPVDPAARMAEAVENGIEGLKAAFAQKLGRKP